MNKILDLFRFVKFHYCTGIGLDTFRTIFSRKRWTEKNKKVFLYNVGIGVFTLVVLSLINNSTFGQKLLNDLYDSIVVADFLDSTTRTDRIADGITLVEFDPFTYEHAENRGFWTPRHTLGASIEQAVDARARVVLVDFTVSRKAPVYLHAGQPLDENELFLAALARAVDKAEATRAVIVLPFTDAPPPEDEYTRKLAALMKAHPEVVKIGLTSVMTDRYDETVRNMLFFKQTGPAPGDVVLSMPLLAYLYSTLDRKAADAEVARLAALIAGDPDFRSAVLPGHGGQVAVYPYSEDRECLPAKLRYRIADRDTYARYGVEDDPFFGRRFRPASWLAQSPDPSQDRAQDRPSNPAQGRDQSQDDGANAIVVIGSTNPEMGDAHKTPLGVLQGVYVLANEVNMLLMAEQINQNPYLKYATDICSILILSALFTHIPLTLSIMVLGFLISSIRTSVAGYLLIRFGIFLDAWVPMMGICFYANIHNFVSSYIDFKSERSTCK